MLVLGFAPSLTWLFIGRSFAGICGANISTASAYIADVTSPENRAKGMGMIGAAFGLGFIFGPAIGGVLSRYGYGAPMFAAAALAAMNFIFALLRLKEPETTQRIREKNRTRKFSMHALREAFGDQRTRTATLVFFALTVAVTQMEVTFAIFMQAKHGLQAQGAGWYLAFMGTIMVVIQGGLIGKLSKRFGETALIVTGLGIITLALILLSNAGTLSVVALALGLLAVGNGITNPSLSSLASKGAKEESRGATMGIYQSAGSLARVVGPPMAGFLYDKQGPSSPFIAAAFLTLGVFWILFMGQFAKLALFKDCTKLFREGGIKAIVRKYGWKVFGGLFAYYLVRDVTLYIIIPWCAARGLLWK